MTDARSTPAGQHLKVNIGARYDDGRRQPVMTIRKIIPIRMIKENWLGKLQSAGNFLEPPE
jgi:hypothetical protein